MSTFQIIMIILGILICGVGSYLLCYFKVKVPQIKQNKEMEQANMELLAENVKLRDEKLKTLDELVKVNEELTDKRHQIVDAAFKLDDVKKEAEAAKQEFLQTNLTIARNEYEIQTNQLKKNYEAAEDSYLKEYLGVMADMVHQSEITMTEKKKELDEVSKELDEVSARLTREKENLDVVIETRKAERAEEEKVDFYRLQITSEDQEEIDILKKAVSKIRDPIALNKAIWKVYYEKPYMALAGRVVGPNRKTGIYKITNISTAESYVGQAVKYRPMKNFS